MSNLLLKFAAFEIVRTYNNINKVIDSSVNVFKLYIVWREKDYILHGTHYIKISFDKVYSNLIIFPKIFNYS